MLSRPQYVIWLIEEDKKRINEVPLNSYYINYTEDHEIIKNWARHLRLHYIDDNELGCSCVDTGKKAEEYLEEYVIPQKYDINGPQMRACDITEILVSDLFEFILSYTVPRGKQENRSGKCQSEHGSDVFAYKFKKKGKFTTEDELIVVEVKAGLSSDSYDPIKKALNDSHNADRDAQRYSHTLDYYNVLENGIKISIEDGLKKDKIKLVVCTSTLAQGVNIPIKYLLISSTRVNSEMMMVRNFQNLIGRTARSGMHTEGTVIITDPILYANRNKGYGYYNWKGTCKLYNPTNSEKCGSRLLSIFDDLKIDHNTDHSGEDVGQTIVNLFIKGKMYYLEEIKKPDIPLNVQYALLEKISILEAIENNICFFINLENIDPYEIAHKLCINSYAYFLADDNKKQLLIEMFNKLTGRIVSIEKQTIINYSKAMIGVELGEIIFEWLNNNILQFENDFELFIKKSIELYYLYNAISVNFNTLSIFIELWTMGYPYYKIANKLNINIEDVEKIANKIISYNYSFFLGNILDIINSMFEEKDTLSDFIKLYQKRVKYGVSNEIAIKLYENGLEDRYIAQSISDFIDNGQRNDLKDILKESLDKCESFLKDMPSIFIQKLYNMLD